MMLAFLCVSAYLLGSIPFGLLFTRHITDIRTQGSGNIGATNVLRTVGKKIGAATLICDMLKGLLPVIMALKGFDFTHSEAASVGTFAIIGHIVPIWLKGKGGKAVATTLGVLLALNYKLALAVIAIWLLTVKLSGISSLGALVGFSAAPVIGWLLGMEPPLVIWLMGIWAAILITHRENIQRLIKKDEKTVTPSKNNQPKAKKNKKKK